MKLKPVLTEKSHLEAKKGKYTFFVSRNLTKNQIKNYVEEVFGVHIKKINTFNSRGKKVVVKLAAKEKIDLFEVKEKK